MLVQQRYDRQTPWAGKSRFSAARDITGIPMWPTHESARSAAFRRQEPQKVEKAA